MQRNFQCNVYIMNLLSETKPIAFAMLNCAVLLKLKLNFSSQKFHVINYWIYRIEGRRIALKEFYIMFLLFFFFFYISFFQFLLIFLLILFDSNFFILYSLFLSSNNKHNWKIANSKMKTVHRFLRCWSLSLSLS